MGFQGIFPSEDVAQITIKINRMGETAKVIPVTYGKRLGILGNYGSV